MAKSQTTRTINPKAPLRVRTIRALLKEDGSVRRGLGIEAIENGHYRLTEDEVYYWSESVNDTERLAALAAVTLRAKFGDIHKAPDWGHLARMLFAGLATSQDSLIARKAWQIHKNTVSPQFIEQTLLDNANSNDALAQAIARSCEWHNIPKTTIKRWMFSDEPILKLAALYHHHDQTIPLAWIREGIETNDKAVQLAAALAAHWRELPARDIEDLFNSPYYAQRIAVLTALTGHEDAMATIHRGLEERRSNLVRTAAAMACRGVNLTRLQLDEWLSRSDTIFKLAAMYASVGRDDIPREWVAEYLNLANKTDSDEIPKAATLAALSRKDFAPVRHINVDPEQEVYLRCVGKVIAIATIPTSAHVCRIDSWNKDRFYTNEIHVTDLIGDLYGESVGIPIVAGRRPNLEQRLRVDGDYLALRFQPYPLDVRSGIIHPGFEFYLDYDAAVKAN